MPEIPDLRFLIIPAILLLAFLGLGYFYGDKVYKKFLAYRTQMNVKIAVFEAGCDDSKTLRNYARTIGAWEAGYAVLVFIVAIGLVILAIFKSDWNSVSGFALIVCGILVAFSAVIVVKRYIVWLRASPDTQANVGTVNGQPPGNA